MCKYKYAFAILTSPISQHIHVYVPYLIFLICKRLKNIKSDLDQNLFDSNNGFMNHLKVLSVSIKVCLVSIINE